MFFLYLRFTIPLALLWWGIKKNPFYKSYPIMLPFMFVLFVIGKYCGLITCPRQNEMK